jgi:hypothetical protein
LKTLCNSIHELSDNVRLQLAISNGESTRANCGALMSRCPKIVFANVFADQKLDTESVVWTWDTFTRLHSINCDMVSCFGRRELVWFVQHTVNLKAVGASPAHRLLSIGLKFGSRAEICFQAPSPLRRLTVRVRPTTHRFKTILYCLTYFTGVFVKAFLSMVL